MKLVLLVCALCVLGWGVNQAYQKKTRFGLLSKFSAPTFAASKEWELPPLSFEDQEVVDRILSQKFTYLARGSQAFAFISEDGKTILKLFKQHKWHPKNIYGYIPLPFNPYYKDYLVRQKKQHALLSSCMAALLHVKEDTGVLYAHLNPTPLKVSEISIVDKHGKGWKLDLSKSCFMVQKKADLFYPHIESLMAKGDIEGGKNAITATFKLLDRFNAMGVYDNNVILRKNFGFIGEQPIQFDIGKFKFDPNRKANKEEIRITTENFYRWIKKNYPELISHFDATLEGICPVSLCAQ